MRGTGWTVAARIGLRAGILVLGVAAAACALKAAGRQTDVMEKSGKVKVSAAELRAQVNDLADLLTGRIEETADRTLLETRDPAIRRRALVLKVDGIPAIYTAAYRADPLAGLVDLWALAFQAVEYTGEGVGRDALGPHQHLAREGARLMLADVDAAVSSIATTPEAFQNARASVADWARLHPIERTLASRASISGFAARLRAEGRDAVVAVGAVSETIENLSERMNTWAAQLPRQARWEAELLATDMVKDPVVEEVLGDVHAVGAAARQTNELLADLPALVGPAASPLREMLAAERRAVLEGVNGQRLLTLEYVTAERLAVLAALREERIAVVAALHQERLETLKEVDAIKTRGVESAVAGLMDVVDHALVRIAALFVLLLLTTAALAVVVYRLTLGRRPRST